MRAGGWTLLFVAALASLPSGILPRTAHAEPRRSLEECAGESESGQRQQRARKLRDAREDFRRCAADGCPSAIATFCIGRLGEVESALPTVVVQVRDPGGRDLADFDLLIDGSIVGKADGRSIEVDPGPHTFVAQHGTGATAPTMVVVAEGEKHRVLILSLPPGEPPPSKPAPPPPRPMPPLVYLLGGLGLVALGGGAVFWGSALSARSDELEPGGCAPRCPDDVRDSIRSRILVGDSLALAGVLSLGVAAYLLLRTPQAPRPASAR
jgi:hypothetical protein